jgi:8-oxo-dGTP diphosphatase
VEVIKVWNGRYACTLQAALRLTNEAFASHLGIAVRTVAAWHADSDVVPRAEVQQLLDAVYEKAPDAVHRRFALLEVSEQESNSPTVDTPSAQALRVAIAIVLRDDAVLMVCRRGDDAAGITWQFPAGVVKPGVQPEVATVRETLAETGVHCAVRQHLGSRLHPITGVMCEYFLCEYLAGEAHNSDVLENVDVMWTPKNSVTRFIEVSRIYAPILAALEGQA